MVITRHDKPVARLVPEGGQVVMSHLSELAATYQLSVYDAAYLELAQRRRLVLGCTDGPPRKAAKQTGVNLWV